MVVKVAVASEKVMVDMARAGVATEPTIWSENLYVSICYDHY